MDDCTAQREPQEKTIERLLNAGAWLKQAAQELERGNPKTASQMVHLGRVCLEDAEDGVARLAAEADR